MADAARVGKLSPLRAAFAADGDEPETGRPVMDLLPGRPLSRQQGPLYRQLAALLRTPIVDGALVPGDTLPREADLAGRFGVSLITVRQALRELEGDGLIRKRAAKPAVVTAARSHMRSSVGFESLAAIAASTRDRKLRIRSYRKEVSSLASRAFGLAEDARCHCLRAILLVDDRPACQCTFYFPPAVGDRLRRSDFDDVVVFRSVQHHLGIRLSGARVTVRAELADASLARALDYDVGEPILVTEMLYRSADGEAIELAINKNRADFFSIAFDAPNDLD